MPFYRRILHNVNLIHTQNFHFWIWFFVYVFSYSFLFHIFDFHFHITIQSQTITDQNNKIKQIKIKWNLLSFYQNRLNNKSIDKYLNSSETQNAKIHVHWTLWNKRMQLNWLNCVDCVYLLTEPEKCQNMPSTLVCVCVCEFVSSICSQYKWKWLKCVVWRHQSMFH